MAKVTESARELIERIKRQLPVRPIREVSMFGSIAIMLDDSMLVAVSRDGSSLLARVLPASDELLVQRTDATRAEMGTGRSMGVGWIRVDAESLSDDAVLDLWIGHALERFEAAA